MPNGIVGITYDIPNILAKFNKSSFIPANIINQNIFY